MTIEDDLNAVSPRPAATLWDGPASLIYCCYRRNNVFPLVGQTAPGLAGAASSIHPAAATFGGSKDRARARTPSSFQGGGVPRA